MWRGRGWWTITGTWRFADEPGRCGAAEHTLAAGLDAAGEDSTLAVERAWLLLEHCGAIGDLVRAATPNSCRRPRC